MVTDDTVARRQNKYTTRIQKIVQRGNAIKCIIISHLQKEKKN